MKHMETVDAIIDLANTGRQLSADEALGAVVRLINGMSPAAGNYDARLAILMQIGATLWQLSLAGRATQRETEAEVRQGSAPYAPCPGLLRQAVPGRLRSR